MFEIYWIQEQVKKGEYYFSKHGDQERQNYNLTIAEVEEVLLTGRIIEQYADTGRGNLFSCWIYGNRKSPTQYKDIYCVCINQYFTLITSSICLALASYVCSFITLLYAASAI